MDGVLYSLIDNIGYFILVWFVLALVLKLLFESGLPYWIKGAVIGGSLYIFLNQVLILGQAAWGGDVGVGSDILLLLMPSYWLHSLLASDSSVMPLIDIAVYCLFGGSVGYAMGKWNIKNLLHSGMKRLILVLALIVLSLGTSVHFLSQKTLPQKSPEVQDIAPVSIATQNTPPKELVSEGGLWVITTKFNTVFIENAASNRVAYESSYAKVVTVDVPIPAGVKILDSQQSTVDPNSFFVTTESQDDVEAAYIVNIQQKTFKKLFSSVDQPDFKLASIGGVSPQESAILFTFASCRGCDGGIIGGAVYSITGNTFKNIGPTPLFRWGANTYEYKIPPAGCEAYFGNPFRDETKETACDKKLEAAAWLRETI